MTVLQLKELLQDAPDDMIVCVSTETVLGGFAFQEACIGESGIIELAPPEEGEHGFENGAQIFVLMPHGSTVHEDGLDEEDDSLPPEVFN